MKMTLIEFEKKVMKRPFRYCIIDSLNSYLNYERDREPISYELMTYQPTSDPKIFILKQTKTAYIDTRYEAKIRLYNYLKKKYEVPERVIWSDLEIGKSKPILNF